MATNQPENAIKFKFSAYSFFVKALKTRKRYFQTCAIKEKLIIFRKFTDPYHREKKGRVDQVSVVC